MLQCLKHKAFKLQDERATAEPPPNTQTECGTCASASTNPQPIKVVTSPQYHNPDAAVELIRRVNEADIFVHDIWVSAPIDTWAEISTIAWDSYEEHGYEIHPVKQILQLEETGGLPFHTWGI